MTLDVQGVCSSAPREWSGKCRQEAGDPRGKRARPGDLLDAGLRPGLPRLCFLTRVFLESGPHFPSSSPLPPAAWARANLLWSHFQRKVSVFFPPSPAPPPPGLLRGLAPAPLGARGHLGPVGQGSGPPPPPLPPQHGWLLQPEALGCTWGARDAPRELWPGRFGVPGLSTQWGGLCRPEGPPGGLQAGTSPTPGHFWWPRHLMTSLLWRPFSPLSLPRVPDASAGLGGHFVRAGGAGWHGAGAGGAAGGASAPPPRPGPSRPPRG